MWDITDWVGTTGVDGSGSGESATDADAAEIGGLGAAYWGPVRTAGLVQFDPGSHAVVAGDPVRDMQFWHVQSADTCAIAAQEFVLDSLGGRDYTEAELVDEAYANGWYSPGMGTPIQHLDSLLEAHDIATETRADGDLQRITQDLGEGGKVVVAVDSSEIWEPGRDYRNDELSDPVPGQGADHAVQVIGIVDSAHGPMVVLNDSATADGRGMLLAVDEFEDAWADSGHYMVTAGPGADDDVDAFA